MTRTIIKKWKMNTGITLLELLISIAIVGLLMVIVISSVNTSRIKAYDSKIREQLSRFRSSAELYYSNQNPNGYTPNTSLCTAGIFADTSSQNGRTGDFLDFTGVNPAPTVYCQANQNAYAIKASLASNAYFCVDSRGNAKIYQGAIPPGSVLQCP